MQETSFFYTAEHVYKMVDGQAFDEFINNYW